MARSPGYFYAHFETKDELIVALCTEIVDHVFSGDPGTEAGHDFSSAGKDVASEVTHILYHIQESRPYLASLLKSSSGELFMAELRNRVAKELAGELSAGIEGVPEDYLANHVACDFAETVRPIRRTVPSVALTTCSLGLEPAP